MHPALAKGVAANVSGLAVAGIDSAVGGAAGAGAGLAVDENNRQLHMQNYERLRDRCRGGSSTECQTINRMSGVRSGMPTDDAKIPASMVVDNYDANENVVSYTLIDRKSNQPTMILEPVEFNVYRNSVPSIQAMMQNPPQYTLDFASAGLYSANGDNQRALEHVSAGVTSRDYVRDVALGAAGAVVSATQAVRPAPVVNPTILDELVANGVR